MGSEMNFVNFEKLNRFILIIETKRLTRCKKIKYPGEVHKLEVQKTV